MNRQWAEFGPPTILYRPLFYSNINSLMLRCDFTMFKYACLKTNPACINESKLSFRSIYNVPGVRCLTTLPPKLTIFLKMGLIISSLQMMHSEVKEFAQSHKARKLLPALRMTGYIFLVTFP